VPIHLTAPGGAGTLARERIDEPLGVPAVVSIEETVDGERYVLGPSAGFAREAPPGGAPELEASPSFAGFYNRGLTLHETTEPPAPELRSLRVKIASPALGHTLSRDDVRRDRAYARVVARARALVPKLEGALAEALERAAREAAAGRDPRAYAGLLDAALAPPLRLDAARLALPLTDEVHGATTLPRCELAGRVLVAAGPSALTAALARAGRPVVRDVHPAIRAGLHGVAAADAASRFVLLHERPVPTDADRALCDAVLRGLAAAGARASRVALCRTEGASPPRAAVALAGDGEAAGRCLCSVEEAASWWRRWGAIDALLLVETSPLVERARERAAGDATQAGHLLARALLVEERGTLDATTSDRLLEAAVGDAS
jgi:molecular chaperone HtpG